MKPKQKRKQTRVTFRMPPELAVRVIAAKDRERRSMNTQLVMLVERGLAA